MKYDASYRYYAEDIDKVGNKFDSPEQAYNEAKMQLSKLGYEVTKLDANLQFDYISKSTGVRYEGNIGVLYDEPKLEDGWMFEIEDDGRRVIYKEDEIYGNVVVSKLPDGYYEFEDSEGGFPEVFPNLRRLTIKKRLHIPNSVIQHLEANINEYFEPYYDKWDRLVIPYEYLEIGKYYTPTDSYTAYKFVGEKDDELIFENKKGEEIKYSKYSKFSPYENKKKSDFMPLPKYMTMKDGAAKNVERINYIKTSGKPSKYENKDSLMTIKEINEKMKTLLENSISREWEFNGNTFKETILETKQVEVLPGLVLTYNKIEKQQNGKTVRFSWEIETDTNYNECNKFIMDKIANDLGITDKYTIGASAGAIPININFKNDLV